jgi:hypothetical protein
MTRAGVNSVDQINIYSLHTPQANKELEIIDPSNQYGLHSSVSYNKFRPSIDMDLALGIYELTKNPN